MDPKSFLTAWCAKKSTVPQFDIRATGKLNYLINKGSKVVLLRLEKPEIEPKNSIATASAFCKSVNTALLNV